jgi:hypothetical protein
MLSTAKARTPAMVFQTEGLILQGRGDGDDQLRTRMHGGRAFSSAEAKRTASHLDRAQLIASISVAFHKTKSVSKPRILRADTCERGPIAVALTLRKAGQNGDTRQQVLAFEETIRRT